MRRLKTVHFEDLNYYKRFLVFILCFTVYKYQLHLVFFVRLCLLFMLLISCLSAVCLN